MANQLCFRCFKMKGDFEVCPHCGYVEGTRGGIGYELAPGTVLHGRYIIGVTIGVGGFGITYKAFDTSLGIVVAIKEFYPAGLVSRGEKETKIGVFSGEKENEFRRQLNRFLEEARNLALFSREHDIVNVYDFFEENQTAYFIMEYVEAMLLKDRLKQSRLTVDEAGGYMLALLDALAKIHKQGILHRDISPDNIFVTGENTVKVFDFGAAKLQNETAVPLEAAVVKAGYTPPEQYAASGEQTASTDIYAAAAVYYEMLTGEKPLDAPERASRDDLKWPHELGVQMEPWLERIVMKALSLDPAWRFQSAEEFKQAIVNRQPVALWGEQEVPPAKPGGRRFIAIGAAAAAVIVGSVALIGWLISSGAKGLDPAKIKADRLTVWLSAVDTDSGESIKQALLADAEQECPQIELEVEVIGREQYTARMKQAIEEDELPDVFCTDSIDASDYCTELSELMDSMELADFLYLQGMDKTNVYEIPTVMQTAVCYVSEEKASAVPELLEEKELSGMGDALGYAGEEGMFDRFGEAGDAVYMIAGDLSDMNRVKSVTVDQVPPVGFAVVPVLDKGRLIVAAENCYGVNRDCSGNRRMAGELVVSLLLDASVQSSACMDNDEGIPLNRAVLDIYRDNKMTTYLAFLKDYDLEDGYYEVDDIDRMR